MNFADAVKAVVRTMLKKQQRRGKATNIKLDKCTCDVDLGNDVFLYGVKLKATEAGSDKGIVIVPKDKSIVVAEMVEDADADWCLVQWSEIDSAAFFFKEGGKVEMKDNGEVHLNGSNKGALVVIQNLVNKLNALEQKHDALVAKYNSHKHTGVMAGPATSAVSDTPSTDSIGAQTTVDDLKNDKVKHGA